MNPPATEALYVISLEEIFWGALLVGITMAMHGAGMLLVLRLNNNLKGRLEKNRGLISGLLPLIVASCAIMLVHLSEVLVWAAFFYLERRVPQCQHGFLFLTKRIHHSRK